MYEGTRTGLPISPALEAATLNRTRPSRYRLATPPTPVRQHGGTRFVALADLQVRGDQRTLLRPADETRMALVITNNDLAVNIRIGDSSVTPTQGVRLFAGSSMRISALAEIFAISEGAAVTVSMAEELV